MLLKYLPSDYCNIFVCFVSMKGSEKIVAASHLISLYFYGISFVLERLKSKESLTVLSSFKILRPNRNEIIAKVKTRERRTSRAVFQKTKLSMIFALSRKKTHYLLTRKHYLKNSTLWKMFQIFLILWNVFQKYYRQTQKTEMLVLSIGILILPKCILPQKPVAVGLVDFQVCKMEQKAEVHLLWMIAHPRVPLTQFLLLR